MTPSPTAASGVATVSHLAGARVMARSFREHHPGARVAVLVADDVHGAVGPDEPFEVLRPDDVGIDDAEMARRGLLYTRLELACSLKAAAMRALLQDGHEVVLHLDVDCLVLAPMDPMFDAALEQGVALTTHGPMRAAGDEDSELNFIANGVFNAGVLAASAAAGDFVGWWHERTARHALHDRRRAMVGDQGWMALAPALFDVAVVRDRTVNVMGWNLGTDDLEWRDGRPLIGGRRVRCFHLCGHFDPGPPMRLMPAADQQEPWTPLSELPGTARLCARYASLLAEAETGAEAGAPGGYDALPDGTAVTPTARGVYGDALMAHERSEGPEPPNPFADGDCGAFMDWLASPARTEPGISRYLLHVWHGRPDLQAAFAEPGGPNREAFLRWAQEASARGEVEVPPPVLR